MRVLVDDGAERQVADVGYVVIDLLNEEQVAALQEGWRDLSTTHHPVWDPTGLAATVRHPGLDHAADQRIRSVVQPVLDTVMVDRLPFMSSYLVKRPRSAALPAHIDWRLVDEPAALTHGCWMPITGAAPTTGALGVVPRSHLQVTFDRTPEDAGHEWTERFVDSGVETELLHVEIGQAVIYDHRLVHFSTANDADTERVAVNCGISSTQDAPAAQRLLLDMMRRGMSQDGGSQIDPTSGNPPDPPAPEARPARWWGRLRRRG